jgi:hypothetical protein
MLYLVASLEFLAGSYSMDSAIAGLIGGVIGAAAGLVGSLSTSWLALKKEREQALRNKEIEQEKWLRERLT